MAKEYMGKESFTYFVTLLTTHLKTLVKKTDVVNALDDVSTDKPLAAAQGKALKELIEKVPASDTLMQKATYDSDGDGTIDKAALADNATHAESATTADQATNATNADNATHADSADSATTADNATKLGGHDASEYPLLVEGQIDSKYLPSYVDDVIEGYFHNKEFYKDADYEQKITGEQGKIYLDISSDGGSTSYRYSGTAYVKIVSSDMVAITSQEIDDIWTAATAVV